MKKVTIKHLMEVVDKTKGDAPIKMLPILFPYTFKKLSPNVVHADLETTTKIGLNMTLDMTEATLAHHLKTFQHEWDETRFIMDLFNMTPVEAALLVAIHSKPTYEESVLQKGLKAHMAAESAMDARRKLFSHSIQLPDFKELEKRLNEMNPTYFCEIGQLFKRKSYPKNVYVPMVHKGKVRMVNITSSAVRNDPKCIPLHELKDQWNRKRLTQEEFAKIIGSSDFSDFIRVDLTMDKAGCVHAESFKWETETKVSSSWNKK